MFDKEKLFDIVEEIEGEEGGREVDVAERTRNSAARTAAAGTFGRRLEWGEERRRSGGAGPGVGVGIVGQGDEERPHPPRFIDRVTPLADALANFPPYLRFPPSASSTPQTSPSPAQFLFTLHRGEVYYAFGFRHFRQGNAVITHLQRGLELGQDDYVTYYGVGEIYR